MIHPALTLIAEEALGVALASVVLRGRARLCPTFAAYLAAVLASDLLSLALPRYFHTWFAWSVKETLLGVLKLGLTCQLAFWIFARLPGALAAARLALLLVIGVVLWTLLAPLDARQWEVPARLLPRLATGTAWALLVLMALTVRYRVPLHPWHHAILVSLTPYLAFSGILNSLWDLREWPLLVLIDTVDVAAFIVVATWWAYAAWRTDPEVAPRHQPVLAMLQPWR